MNSTTNIYRFTSLELMDKGAKSLLIKHGWGLDFQKKNDIADYKEVFIRNVCAEVTRDY